ncbi:E3 ubiquitin-protein ligase ubr3-like isoform X2 [Asterias amurensis]|uniref:E3 ubiquitin-protein ligase ubr3-like isoform X2 n=1 Tax=Asterias amurensis TaxID=7602 RepID=UPI003AB8EE10
MATLMRGEKRKVAAQLKAEITRNTGNQQLQELLDVVLSPQTSLEKSDNLDWCRALIAGGNSFDEFAKTVRAYDNATTCGLVWTSNFVAYRCRTCGISPCMSICADCFHGGNHEDHDFNMFRSQAGGACDCGDPSVMRTAGFCNLHGPDKPKNHTVPSDLLPMADVVVPRLVFRFVLYLRDLFSKCSDLPIMRFDLKEGEPLLSLLHELCNMGGAMRTVMTRALTDAVLYQNHTDGSAGCYSNVQPHIKQTQDILQNAQRRLAFPDTPKILRGNPAVAYPLLPSSFVEELLFWAVIFEFPEKIVTLLLKMLPDNTYKELFTKSFVKFYGRIAMSLAISSHPDRLSSRVVHISVQLFSNEDLAIQMTNDLQLIHILIASLQCLLKRTLMDNPIGVARDGPRNCQVANCEHPVMKNHCYWPVISDLTNILSHRSVVHKFFTDPALLKMWTNVLSMFMCMNLNERELHNHVEFEPNAYSTAFSAEIEACAAPMWQLYTHCKDETTAHYTQALLNACVETTMDWLQEANIQESFDPFRVSFHIPLLRYYALLLSQALTKQGVQVTPAEDFLKRLIVFPLQIQAMVSEVFCEMWVRNGLQIKRQAMTYMQCHFCASMIDLDLFLLQVGAVYLDPDFLVTKVFSCFKVLETLTFNQSHFNSQLYPGNEPAMLEGAFYLLATLLSTRTHMGASEEELLRQEMVALLCIQDRPHSQLADQIPEKTGLFNSNEHFESILAEVADYHDPMSETGSGGLQQGRYSPKPHIWETEFDPIHVMLRVMQKKDFQTAMDRYSSHMKQTGRHSGSSGLWPPFKPLKLPTTPFENLHQLLHCKTLHGVIFIILYKAVHGRSITDPVLYLCIALLDMMLQYPTVKKISKTPTPDVIRDGDFSAMFPDNVILNNLRHRIKTVEIPSLHEKPSSSHQRTMDSTDLLLQQLLNEEVSIYSQNLFGLGVGFGGHQNLDEAEPPMEEEEAYPSEEEQDSVDEELDGMEQEEVDDIEEETEGMEVAEVGGDMEAGTVQGDGYDVDSQSASLQTADEPTVPLQDLPATTSTATSSSKKSSRVQTVLWTPCKMLTINESMLDLLVKLHSKMVGKEGSYLPPSMRTEKGERNDQGVQVGGGAYYVRRLLDKICHLHPESQQQIEALCQLKDQPDNGQTTSSALSSTDRRKKAREAQQKLFAKLAAEQRTFLEKSLETGEGLAEVPETDGDDRGAATPKEAEPREMFECVICGQTAPSTGDNPIGMVALMQATGVLGHQSQVSEAQTLPTQSGEEISHAGRCRNVNERRKEDLTRNFNKDSLQASVDTEWTGVHIQSCRHYIHLSCHQSYLNSLQEYQSHHLHVHSKGEYECPLCRQLANFVLPCMPSLRDSTSSKPHGVERNYSCIIAEVMDRLQHRRERPVSLRGILTATENVFVPRLQMENRFNTQGSDSMRLGLPPREMRQILLQSTARVNLELDLVVRGNLLTSQSSSQPASKRSCLGTLLEVLSFIQSDEMYIAMASKAWSSLTGVEPGTLPVVPRAQSNDVPILLRDPISLLLYLITVMRHPVHKDYFTCIVRALYAMLYTQALSVISCRMPQTERKAWTESGKSCQEHSNQIQMDSLLSEIIVMYSQSRLYQDVDTHQGLAICQSVWTPQCVETAIQQYCLPFLRIAALMQHHLYREELPTCQRQDVEFEVLVNFLNLCTPPSVDEKQPNLYSARCLHFVGDSPSNLLRVWCQEFLVFVNKNHPAAKRLLLHNPIFYPPRLLQLPTRYDDVFQYYRQRRCDRCKNMPSRPVVCLVCGALICLNAAGLGCHLSGIRAPIDTEHSLECGSGTVVYLDINSSTVIIIRGKRLCYWASVYLDRHGEEDRELKRGKPLILCQQRYKMLEHLWRSHGFNHSCKNWVLLGGHGGHHF